MGFQFNFNGPSFLLGFGAGVLTSAAVYRAYRAYDQWRKTTLQTVDNEKVFVVQRGNRRYTTDLIRLCQTSHLFGHRVPLRDVLIEPRFIPMRALPNAPDDDTPRNPFEVVPFIVDFPALHGVYHLPTLSVEQLGQGQRALALIGPPASGLTTALHAIALWSMGQVSFAPPKDKVAQQLEAEESALDAKTRAERIKSRLILAQQAREKFNLSLGKESQSEEEREEARTPILRRLAPLFIHLRDVSLDSADYGGRIDSAEPLLRALQHTSRRLTAKIMPRTIYRLLDEGRALVLIDGYRELEDETRQAIIHWLGQLLEDYGRNRFIIASPSSGYQSLVDIGCAPIFIRPFGPRQHAELALRFNTHWGRLAPGRPFDANGVDQAIAEGRYQNIYDFTLNLWAKARGETGGYAARCQAYLADRLSDEALKPYLQRLAVEQLEASSFTRRSFIKRELGAALTSEGMSVAISTLEMRQLAPEAVKDTATDEGEKVPSASEAPSVVETAQDKQAQRERRQMARQISAAFTALLKSGLLQSLRDGAYRLRYNSLTAQLGAIALAESSEPNLHLRMEQSTWSSALVYANELLDLSPLVSECLLSIHDARLSNILPLCHWLRYGGAQTPWRNLLLKFLGNAFVAPNQYSAIRERIAAALVNSGDMGTLVIFRKALGNSSPVVRRLSALALGALRDAELESQLMSMALRDPQAEVQIAASLALGSLGTEDGLLAMVEVWQQTQNQEVQRGIAETLANNPEEGYHTLYEAIQTDNTLLRRAAVWGLGRIETDWALIALNRVYLEDEEWYVKSAAETVFAERYEINKHGVQDHPPLSELKWLNEWADREIYRGALSSELNAVQRLMAAIQNAQDATVRQLAASIVGHLAVFDAIEALYRALNAPQDGVRDEAQRSLIQLEERLGQALPLPLLA
ncbi:MAG: HEAT repeat domain-containing protein [Anaerolineae bacterium]|nr:HEAT repeat domain-containing protein [Anaerolineae bacterium]MDW8172419.1 HEAT repeat domain-containing protein [Anaerolineae bacterium]